MTVADPQCTDRVSVEVVRGRPTEDELAALVAVVTEAYVREAEQAVAEEPKRSAWSVSQRGLRRPLQRELGWSRGLGGWQG